MSDFDSVPDDVWQISLEIVLHITSLVHQDDIFREFIAIVQQFYDLHDQRVFVVEDENLREVACLQNKPGSILDSGLAYARQVHMSSTMIVAEREEQTICAFPIFLLDTLHSTWVISSGPTVLTSDTITLFSRLCQYVSRVLYNAQLWEVFHNRVMEVIDQIRADKSHWQTDNLDHHRNMDSLPEETDLLRSAIAQNIAASREIANSMENLVPASEQQHHQFTATMRQIERVTQRHEEVLEYAARIEQHTRELQTQLNVQSHVTALKINEALEQERAKALSVLFSHITHDLMTPITIVKSGLFMLAQGAPNTSQRIARMEKNLNSLTHKLHDLIFMARLDSGEYMQPTLEDVDIGNLIYQALREAESRYPDKIHKPDVLLPPNSIIFNTDAFLLRRALLSVIDNALRYTSFDGRIRITLEATNAIIRFSVTDNGPGIRADAIKHIFGRTYRQEQARTGYASTGLGLSITHEIVKALHGEIVVESHPGVATTFTISLPIRS